MVKRRIPQALRQQVRDRASGQCEYCLIYDWTDFMPHEADHVIAEKHGGVTTIDNLAWACATCNRYKGTDLSSVDPLTLRIVPLFNPRKQNWHRHFHLDGARITSLTASGRATERLLRLNDVKRIRERAGLLTTGRYPRT